MTADARRGTAAGIFALAAPMLVSQLASIGTNVADTLIAGHHATADLAAVAVGGGLFISVVIALIGILYAAAPIIAHHVGAGRRDDIAPAFQQAVWMALFLSLPGALLLALPDPLLALSQLDPVVEAKTRDYLLALAFAVPGALLFRAFQALMNGIGQPRPVMVIMLACLAVHVPLAWALTTGAFGPPLGALGCGLSTLAVNWLSVACALIWLKYSPQLRALRPFHDWQAPKAWAQREMLRLGGPMGVSNFVEITSFTLIALFVARLGADVVGGHRVIANINGVCFMLPLALGSGTLVLVGQAAGAHDWLRARHTALTGLAMASVLAVFVGLLLWLSRESVLAFYSKDPAVLGVARSLLPYVALFVLIDAAHTLASFALRGYKVTVAPMIVHTVCFWGVGLGSGYVLAFHGLPGAGIALIAQPMGAAGFWLATLLSTVLAGLMIGVILLRVIRRHPRAVA
ncbi:MAG: MATE family efflux transporter [Methyloversatilis sp.]|nr:MATE family efflux transporter [Methyloversatilis sp.]